jgi:hypothetical protein
MGGVVEKVLSSGDYDHCDLLQHVGFCAGKEGLLSRTERFAVRSEYQRDHGGLLNSARENRRVGMRFERWRGSHTGMSRSEWRLEYAHR